ncbi:MAG: trigger factor [Armatimonadota bacterium]|nr:trigger factor [Armatimonadota bacterium]
MLKTKEQLDPCKVELNIEVEAERVAEALEHAFQHLSKRVSVPGFRKGKAPRALIERYIDEESLKDRAVRALLPEAYEDAVKEAEITPYDLPDVEIVQFDQEQPLIFKATVPLAPKIELGEYVNLTVERITPMVSDEDVERQIDDIRQRAAKLESIVDRPIKKDDIVYVELRKMDDPEAKPNLQMVQAGSNLDAFDEKLIGMQPGDEQVVEVQYPEDYHDKELAGKTLQLKARAIEIKERRVPELDDEFAKSVGADSVDDLRKTLKSRMETMASDVAQRQVESSLIWQIVENSEIHFPYEMVVHEVEHRMKDITERLDEAKVELVDYLRAEKKSFEELQEEMASNAERDIRTNLALLEIARREKISVSDEDVDAEIGRLAEERKVAKASMQAYIDRTDGAPRLKSRLQRKKVLDFLVNSSNIKNVAMKGDSE